MLSNMIISFIVGVVSAYLGFRTLVGTLAFVAKAIGTVKLTFRKQFYFKSTEENVLHLQNFNNN